MRNELGLSDGYAEALGEYIGRSAREMGANVCGVIVVTHSRRLVAGLVRGLGGAPCMLAMESGVETVGQWLERREERSVEDLLELKELSHARFREVQEILKG